jgi:hypothetical protein
MTPRRTPLPGTKVLLMTTLLFTLLGLVAVGSTAVVTFRGGMRPVPRASAIPESLTLELDRARRYEHTFGLVRLRARPDASDYEADEVISSLTLRRTDHAWSDGDDRYVILPETTAEATRVWIQRLQARAGAERLVIDVAHFPADGLTADALLDRLDHAPNEQTERLIVWADPSNERAVS